MTDELRVKAVFDLAAEAPDPAARAELLDRVCGVDRALRVRVEALLKAHDWAGDFLARPAAGVVPPDDGRGTPRGSNPPASRPGPSPAVGGVVGDRYKLLEEIGEGGMGTVWMAEQTDPVRRRVAVKLIKPGMDSRQVVARFEAERQALALMDHPNIARVLDGGATPDGRPYFVMELVKGTPITKYCDELRLEVPGRLALFADVCRAVQHAHQKGVIHRDLKPNNVLVAPYDGTPVVKVIDFGVAKAAGPALTDKTLFTGFGAVVGTPEYMSPEQAELNNQDVDTRSDIYSLGVLLYELLTGTTPLTRNRVKGAALIEVLRLVREEDPPRPSTRLSTTAELPGIAAGRGVEPAKLSRLVRGELDWVVMKALAKDRGRRYETASGLVQDVERYLAGEPVSAVPPSAGYRLRTFARRNRRPLSAAGAAAVALLVAVGGVGWAGRERGARPAGAAADAAARRGRLVREVEAAVREAEAARDRALARVADPHAWDLALAEARADLARADGFAAQDPAALTPALRDRLDAVRTALAADGNDRRFAARFEEVRLAAVEVDLTRSEFVTARSLPALAAALRDGYDVELGVTPPDGAAAAIRRRPVPVRDLLSAALEHARAPGIGAASPRDVEWVGAVLDRADDDPWRRRARALAAAGDWVGMEALAAQPAAARQPAAVLVSFAARMPRGADPRTGFLRHARRAHPPDFWVNHELALALHYGPRSRPAEAAGFYTAALAARPHNPAAWVNLGNALKSAGDPDGAEAAFREALRVAKDYPMAHLGLGDLLRQRGRAVEAVAEYREAVRLRPAHPEPYVALAEALAGDSRDPAGAVAALREGVAAIPRAADLHARLGAALREQGKADEADAALRRAAVLYREAFERRPGTAVGTLTLGVKLWKLGEADEAIERFREAVHLDPKYALASFNLGTALWHRGDRDAALPHLRRAVELAPDAVAYHRELGQMLAEWGKPDEAAPVLRRAVELDPADAWTRDLLVRTLIRADRPADAAAASREGLKSDPAGGDLHVEVGRALAGRGQVGRAEAVYRDVIALCPGTPAAATAANNLAWLLATGPDPGERHPAGAVRLAKAATELAPDAGDYWNTLGVALYRAGRFAGAVEALEAAMKLRAGGDAFDWFFLAMAHHRLGRTADARAWYGRAVAWAEANAPTDGELIRFRVEAEDVLRPTRTVPELAPTPRQAPPRR